jgi:hypothetical protein
MIGLSNSISDGSNTSNIIIPTKSDRPDPSSSRSSIKTSGGGLYEFGCMYRRLRKLVGYCETGVVFHFGEERRVITW